MRRFLFLLPLLASCTQLPVAMPNGVVAHATMVGGKGVLSYDPQGRPIYTYNNQDSLQHFFQFGGALAAGIVGVAAQKSSDALSAANTASAAGVTKNAANNVTKQLKINSGTQIKLAKIAKAPVPIAKSP